MFVKHLRCYVTLGDFFQSSLGGFRYTPSIMFKVMYQNLSHSLYAANRQKQNDGINHFSATWHQAPGLNLVIFQRNVSLVKNTSAFGCSMVDEIGFSSCHVKFKLCVSPHCWGAESALCGVLEEFQSSSSSNVKNEKNLFKWRLEWVSWRGTNLEMAAMLFRVVEEEGPGVMAWNWAKENSSWTSGGSNFPRSRLVRVWSALPGRSAGTSIAWNNRN